VTREVAGEGATAAVAATAVAAPLAIATLPIAAAAAAAYRRIDTRAKQQDHFTMCEGWRSSHLSSNLLPTPRAAARGWMLAPSA